MTASGRSAAPLDVPARIQPCQHGGLVDLQQEHLGEAIGQLPADCPRRRRGTVWRVLRRGSGRRGEPDCHSQLAGRARQNPAVQLFIHHSTGRVRVSDPRRCRRTARRPTSQARVDPQVTGPARLDHTPHMGQRAPRRGTSRSAAGFVLVDHRRALAVMSMRAIRSLMPTPLAAAKVLPVWRRSWKCTSGAPIASAACFQPDIRLKLLRRPLKPAPAVASGNRPKITKDRG